MEDGRSLTLTPVGYQFNAWSNHYDGNWLRIEMRAREPGRTWHRLVPALMTTELAHLCNWLENIAAGTFDEWSFEATEPCIAFERRSAERFSVLFRLEFDPEGRFDDCVRWTVSVADTNLAEFAAELRKEAAAYPERPETSAGG